MSKKQNTQGVAEITPLCLSLGLLVRGFWATVLLVMSPAAQYRHRAGTAEDRQSWQDRGDGDLLHLTQSHTNTVSKCVCVGVIVCVSVCVCVMER